MASCDVSTEKIYGCEKGSWLWWHEKGHIEFSKTSLSTRIGSIQEIILMVWMFSLTLSVLNKYMLIISLPTVLLYIWIYVYEERWCNRYADKHYNRKI